MIDELTSSKSSPIRGISAWGSLSGHDNKEIKIMDIPGWKEPSRIYPCT